jgi:hypothetical protein
VTEEELARAGELRRLVMAIYWGEFSYLECKEKQINRIIAYARQEREAEREMIAEQSQWKTLPDEQAWWWWYWTGSDYAVPHICSVMVSKTGAKDRYFVADGNLAPWCDEMKGFWLKIDYPNVPTRAEQK